MNKLTEIFSFLNGTSFTSIEDKILKLLKVLPKLPKAFVDFLVTVTPYLAIIAGVLSLYSLVPLLLLRNMYYVMIPISIAPVMYIMIVSAIQYLISGLLLITAFVSLKEKKVFGWRLLFWSANVSIVASLATLNIPGAIISGAISWYLLSQIRSRYI